MNHFNLIFFLAVILTVIYMIAIVSGSFNHLGASYYLGIGGFLILYYFVRTYLMIRNRNNKIIQIKLNVFDKLCGYVGLFNGFIFMVISAVVFCIALLQMKLPTIGEIIMLALCITYGYSIVFYVRRTLKELS